jgi:hypothetical protein
MTKQEVQWKPEELARLGQHSDAEVARRTGRTRRAVECKRRRMGIAPHRGECRPWTAVEDGVVFNAAKGALAEVAKMLDRSAPAVYQRRMRLRRMVREENGAQ